MAFSELGRGPIAATEHERATLARIDGLLHDDAASGPRLAGPDGEQIDLPESVSRALRQVVHALAKDQAVTVVPIHKQLTTQQAADLLNVSRPYLVQLLEAGGIPYTKTGAHRRIRLDDLIVYKTHRDAARRATLDALTQLNQEMGLY